MWTKKGGGRVRLAQHQVPSSASGCEAAGKRPSQLLCPLQLQAPWRCLFPYRVHVPVEVQAILSDAALNRHVHWQACNHGRWPSSEQASYPQHWAEVDPTLSGFTFDKVTTSFHTWPAVITSVVSRVQVKGSNLETFQKL